MMLVAELVGVLVAAVVVEGEGSDACAAGLSLVLVFPGAEALWPCANAGPIAIITRIAAAPVWLTRTPEIFRCLLFGTFALGYVLLWLMFGKVPRPPKGNQPHND